MKKEYWLVVSLTLIIIVLTAVVIFMPKKAGQDKIKPGFSVVLVERKDSNNFANIKIQGYVNGEGWIPFEGQAGVVKFLDKNNTSLGYAILAIDGDWMINPPLKFEANLALTSWQADSVVNLEFTNENPSGDPNKFKKVVVPFSQKAVNNNETINIKVFFGKNEITGSTCSVVFPIDRTVAKTQSVARVALEELLKGPTQAEKDAGYFSSINPNVKINSLTIDESGIAKVDFDETLEKNVGGSCRVTEIRSEINFTLKQFSTVKNVIISINGRTQDILQP